jgi:amino acid permease
MLSSEGVPRIAQTNKKREKTKFGLQKQTGHKNRTQNGKKKEKKRQENIHFFLSFFVCGGMSEKNFLSLILSGIKKTQNMKRQKKDYFTELFCFVFFCVFLYFWWVRWKNKKKKNDINTLECLFKKEKNKTEGKQRGREDTKGERGGVMCEGKWCFFYCE